MSKLNPWGRRDSGASHDSLPKDRCPAGKTIDGMFDSYGSYGLR
jgi:hypothetical protein